MVVLFQREDAHWPERPTCAVKGAVRAMPTCKGNVGSTISAVAAMEIVTNCAEVPMSSGHPLKSSMPVATAIIGRWRTAVTPSALRP